ncbi:tetratricopeptide repeat protein [Xinfangfangia sp. D13-10-4-6]|uniref:tetratricopeptide repeat protein n=1 Tax=Pseudogemmobacter hezensis TaxID=2737662 RepID=UPI0015576DB8|nr:tetratricopeptide repeat protein [Pseudogemmobacter hezensis]NPD17334.1 tetratricopeptide repeat protein [Pseudogemmobacter hezensis]
MKAPSRFHNHIVAAIAPLVFSLFAAGAGFAQDAAKLDDLYTRLKDADEGAAARIETEILIESGKSGSATVDLLVRRGNEALAAGNTAAAIEHLTAAVDHAPDFTEARSARAIAYYNDGEIGPAMADLATVLQDEPRDFVAWSVLGTILEESDMPEKALAAYRAAAEIHPHYAEVNEGIKRLGKQLEGQSL